MTDEISHAIALLIGAMTTAMLMAASYYWGGPRDRGDRPRAVRKRKRAAKRRNLEVDYEEE